ncbi:hypothetical protein KAJ87_00355 [Candidatus Pacearchaeota archaeon]|nr:hypothetical protein [Candidatus Pacearchaeota archaeon]
MTKKGLVIGSMFFIMLILVNSVLVSAITGSMGNARMILYPEVNGWFTKTIEKSILVKNVNDIPINITLIPDKEGEEFLEVIDKNFILQPGDEKKAEFLVKVKKQGRYEGKINVFFSPINSKKPGVVLSSTIIVIAEKEKDYEEIEEEEKEKNEEVNVITGGNIGINEEGKSVKGLIFLSFSSFILLTILGYLIFLMKEKKSKSKKGKK